MSTSPAVDMLNLVDAPPPMTSYSVKSPANSIREDAPPSRHEAPESRASFVSSSDQELVALSMMENETRESTPRATVRHESANGLSGPIGVGDSHPRTDSSASASKWGTNGTSKNHEDEHRSASSYASRTTTTPMKRNADENNLPPPHTQTPISQRASVTPNGDTVRPPSSKSPYDPPPARTSSNGAYSSITNNRQSTQATPVPRGEEAATGVPAASPALSRQSNRVSFNENNNPVESGGYRPPSSSGSLRQQQNASAADSSHSSHANKRTYDLQKALEMDELEMKMEQLKKQLADRDRQLRQQSEQIRTLESELTLEREQRGSKNVGNISSSVSSIAGEKATPVGAGSTDQASEQLQRRVDHLLMERENLITELTETKKELAAALSRPAEPSNGVSSTKSTAEPPATTSESDDGIGLRNYDPNHPSALKRRIKDLESQLQDLQEAHHSLLLHENSASALTADQAIVADANHLLQMQELRRENRLLKEELDRNKSKSYTAHPSHPVVDTSLRQEMDELKRDMHVMRDRSEQLAAENQRLRDQMKYHDSTLTSSKPASHTYESGLNNYRAERTRVMEDVHRLKRELKSTATVNGSRYPNTSKSKSLANLAAADGDWDSDEPQPETLSRRVAYKAPASKEFNSPYDEARSLFQARPYSGSAAQHRAPISSTTTSVDRMSTSAYLFPSGTASHKYSTGLSSKYGATPSTASSHVSDCTSVLAVDPTHRRYTSTTASGWQKNVEDDDDGDLTSALLDENILDNASIFLENQKTSTKRHNKHRHHRSHQHQRNGSFSGDTASILSDADRELKDLPFSSAVGSGATYPRHRSSEMGSVNAPGPHLSEPSHLRSYTGGPVRMSAQTRPHFTDHHGGLFPTTSSATVTPSITLDANASRFNTLGKHPFAPRVATDIRLGDVVKFSRNAGRISNGLVHFIGSLPGRNDVYLGVELDQEEGKHNGVYEGRRYFQCKPNKGVFVAFNKVIMCYGSEK